MKNLFSTISLILFLNVAHSQDLIIKTSNDSIVAKVLELGINEIRYKQFDFQDGPTYVLLRSEVFSIHYENGKVDTFQTANSEPLKYHEVYKGGDMFEKGSIDAITNYHGYGGAGTVTLITTLIFPPAGLVPAIICSSVNPSRDNLNYPSSYYMQNPEYADGYKIKAKKIKQGKVWMNFGIAIGVYIVAAIAVGAGN